MKKVYLTEHVPESLTTKKHPADIRQKLEAYNTDKAENFNEAPQIRPYPLEKYDTQKTKETIDAAEASPNFNNTGGSIVTTGLGSTEALSALQKLPKNLQAKARRLVPYLLRTNYGDANLSDILYDLTNKNSKKLRTKNPELLRSIITQLSADELAPKNTFIQKLENKYDNESVPSLVHTPHPTRAPHKRSQPTSPVSYMRAISKRGRWLES